MKTFHITARKTTPMTSVTVEALTREEAIAQVVASAEEGEQIEIFQTEEAAETPESPTGATGATGAARLSHQSQSGRHEDVPASRRGG